MDEAFDAAFAQSLAIVNERYASLREDGARVDVANDYTVRVFLPAMMESEYYAINHFSYIGEFSIRTGDSEEAATDLFSIRSDATTA